MKISKEGIGKIANEEMIEHFKDESAKQETNEHMVLTVLEEYLENALDRHEEVLIRMLDGSERWYQLVIKIIYDIGNYGHRPVYAIGKILDIQQQINEKEQLYKESTTDSLTGIYNRAGGFKEINHALSKQGGAIIMADLDKFKQVNDEFGHFAGDHVLIETASILKHVFHEGIVARLGGDEFLLFIQNTNKEEIALLCEQALKEMHEKKYEDAKNQVEHFYDLLDEKTNIMTNNYIFDTLLNDYIFLIKSQFDTKVKLLINIGNDSFFKDFNNCDKIINTISNFFEQSDKTYLEIKLIEHEAYVQLDLFVENKENNIDKINQDMNVEYFEDYAHLKVIFDK